ncbi:MAG: hypothetical protein ACXVBX_00340 [Flavisolibacter sp.]
MKKAFLSLFFIGALAIVGSAQTKQKTTSKTTVKANTTHPATTSNIVTKTSSSSSAAKSNETPMGSTAPAGRMIKRKYKHSAVHKMNEQTSK